ncbi:MAG: FAD-dependent oxidoreductase [Polyangiaceae bacterium]
MTEAASATLKLGIEGFEYADLHRPERLADLLVRWNESFEARDPEGYAKFSAYRACLGQGMKPEDVSDALLAAAPQVSAFVGKLFGVTKELAQVAGEVVDRKPLWDFKKDFAKKRVLKADAGKSVTYGVDVAGAICKRVVAFMVTDSHGDEELDVARAVSELCRIDDTARKAAKAGGATWTDAYRARVAQLRRVLSETPEAKSLGDALGTEPAVGEAGDGARAALVAATLDAFEAWLAARKRDASDEAARWPSLRAPRTLDFSHLVHLRRPSEALPELFVGPENERREREGFALTDLRGDAKMVEQEIDYCLLCHDRDKDSCSKGLRDNKTLALKKNPLGVTLTGCPLDEKISEMHVLRRDGDPLAALSVVTLDNPMCPGTGHRICNDCMKGCVFQKQEPVNIPQVETRVLTEVLSLPWGVEIYGLLTRWNPLDVRRPHAMPYNGKNVLVVGLGPAGYTLAHYLSREGFAVAAVDGLKIEPLPSEWVGTETSAPTPIRNYTDLHEALDDRILLGFGGVSEYGITVRWDKNFLTLAYLTLARNRNLRIFGGVRFGGTLTVDDAWNYGFDHIAIAAGAGRPTIIEMKNNLARGIRKASDFLMALQLTGAFKKDALSNLQIELPAIVIGGGLTAIDTATELLAYYPVQIEKAAARYDALCAELGAAAVRARFDDEEWAVLEKSLTHARELAEEKARAVAEQRKPAVQALLDKWGGVTLVYRKSLADSPAYRLNHEEVEKSLEEGVRYVENLSPVEAVLDAHGHVNGVNFARKDGSVVLLPARSVCVAAGTSPNITYEREHAGTFELDDRKQYFKTFESFVSPEGKVTLSPSKEGFFTSYENAGRTVSFYGDNHPVYAGSVVRAMASAKHGYLKVTELLLHTSKKKELTENATPKGLFDVLTQDLTAKVVEVNRLTKTIVEVVVRAPMAARKFMPGQFYRLQNFERSALRLEGTRLSMEGLALTGAWTDPAKGLLGMIVLEMGGSSNLCAGLKPGEHVVVMGPTGAPTEVHPKETVLLCGGGLGNAVLFSIARAMKALGAHVLYFAGYKKGEDLFKQSDIEAHTDQVIWTTDTGAEIAPRRPQDAHFRGNIVQAMVAYAQGEITKETIPFSSINRIIAIGSDRMMDAVRAARHGVLARHLNPKHIALGSINSPMQCMMKEICAQCLQKHVDPETGKESVVFSCYNQDQELDRVDFPHLASRLRANSMQEKLSSLWLERIVRKHPETIGV